MKGQKQKQKQSSSSKSVESVLPAQPALPAVPVSVDAELDGQVGFKEERVPAELYLGKSPMQIELGRVVSTFYDAQDNRKRLSNRLRIKKDGEAHSNAHLPQFVMTADTAELLEEELKLYEGLEARLFKRIKLMLSSFPVWTEFLSKIKGLGPTIGSVVISRINIRKMTTVSRGWTYAGVNPGMVFGKKWNEKKECWVLTDTLIKADKLTAGFQSPFDQFLRTKLCGVMADCMIKAQGPYTKWYYDRKARRRAQNWGKSDAHRHRDAIRYMVKMFLQDLYVNWRTLEGLEVRKSWYEEYGQHQTSQVPVPLAPEAVAESLEGADLPPKELLVRASSLGMG